MLGDIFYFIMGIGLTQCYHSL